MVRARRSARGLVPALVAAILVAACSGGTSPTSGPTLSLGSPAVRPSTTGDPRPTRTTAPTVTPVMTPGPTPFTSPRLDPEAAFGVLLRPDQMPAESQPGDAEVGETYEFEPFTANHGIRVVSQTWRGTAFSTVFHFVFQFPTDADARAFVRDGEAVLSEEEIGLAPADAGFLFRSILDEVWVHRGEVEAFGVTTYNENYLMRLRNFVVKLFVGGPEAQPALAEGIAFLAARNLGTITLPLAPDATPAPTPAPTQAPSAGPSEAAGGFPGPEEAALLEHVPTDTRASCEAADPFYEQEVDSVRCRPREGLIVDYTSFPSVDDLRTAFGGDLEVADPAPTEAGDCSNGDLVTTYTIDAGDTVGQVMCTTVSSSSGQAFRVIEWTNEPLRILGYLQSATLEWEALVEFWSTKAGPIE